MAKRIVLNVDVNADKAEKTLGEINKEGQTIVKTLGDMREAAARLEEQLEGVDVGTKKYNELRDELVRVNKNIKDQELAFESLDAEGRASSLKSVAGGFADVAGGMTLIAGQNKSLEELVVLIAQVEGATKIVTGSMEAWSDGMKLLRNSTIEFNKAMLTSPVFIIGAVVAAAVAAFALLSDELSAAELAQEDLNDAMANANNQIASEEAQLYGLVGVLKNVNASEEDRKTAIKELNDIIPDYIGFIDDEAIKTGKVNDIIRDYISLIREKAEAAAIEQKLTEELKKRLDIELAIQQAQRDDVPFKEVVIGQLNEQLETQDKIINTLTQEIGVRKINSQTIDDESNDIKDNTKALNDNIAVRNIIIDMFEKSPFFGVSDLFKEVNTNIQETIEEINALDEEFDEFADSFTIVPEDDVFEDAIERYSNFFGMIEGASKESNEKQVADWIDAQEKKLDTFSFFADGVNSLAANIFEVSNNLGNQDEAAQKRRARRQFNIQKGLDIASAGVDGAKGIVKSISIFGPPVPPNILGIAGVATTAAITAAQIAAIASQQFNPGSSNSSGGGSSIGNIGNVSAGSSASSAQPNNIALFGTAGTDQSQTVTPGGQGGGQHAPIIIENHISSVEMTNKQQSLSNAQARASIGL